MAVVNLLGDVRNDGANQALSYGHGGAVKLLGNKHFTVGSADSATSTYYVGEFDLEARIAASSKIWFDDLASSGSPTLDIGLFAVNSNFTDDDDALNDGIDAATVTTDEGLPVIKDYAANGGKKLWEFISGLTSNPGGRAKMYITLKDADVNVGGDMYIEIYGIIG